MPCNCPRSARSRRLSKAATIKATRAAKSGTPIKKARPKKVAAKKASPKKATPCKCT